jgi:MFS family permease
MWFLVIAIPTGALSMTLIASANAAVQISTEPKFRGRVMALYSMIFLGTTPIGAPIVGWIGEEWGARWAMGIGSIVSIVTAVFAALWGFLVWKIRLEWDGRHTPHLVIPGAPNAKLAVASEGDAVLAAAGADTGPVTLPKTEADVDLAQQVQEETEEEELKD